MREKLTDGLLNFLKNMLKEWIVAISENFFKIFEKVPLEKILAKPMLVLKHLLQQFLSYAIVTDIFWKGAWVFWTFINYIVGLAEHFRENITFL